MGWVQGRWINEIENPTFLFKKCLGLNNARAIATQTLNPRTGDAELIDCLNLTTTPDGCLEKVAPLVTALTTGAVITDLSAGARLMFSDGTNTKEWTTGSTIVNRFPAIIGPIAHTMLDVRVSGASVFKTVGSAIAEAVVGQYTGPAVTHPWAPMPKFKQAFVYNGRIYNINAVDSRFLQFSTGYGYDLYDLGDEYIGSPFTILQAGAIPGVLITTHKEGVSVYMGMDPAGEGYSKKFYPLSVIDKTLYSGFVSKVYGYSHIFLCDDGLYAVGRDGEPKNITIAQIDNLAALNTSYATATVNQEGKYLAFGNALALEYDFFTKTLLKRSLFGITGACIWNGVNYFASGANIVKEGPNIDTGAIPCSMTLPFSDMGAPSTKSFEALYFTGIIGYGATFTVTDQTGKSWRVGVPDIGSVTNYRIKAPKGLLGNHVSLKIECVSGAFRLEELRVTLAAGKRSR